MGEREQQERGIALDPVRCKQARRARGLTQASMAEASRGPDSLSRATIKRAEKGVAIDLASARRYAELLAVRLDVLRADKDPECLNSDSQARHRAAIAIRPFQPVEEVGAANRSPLTLGGVIAEDLLCEMTDFWLPVSSPWTGQLPSAPEPRYVVRGSVRQAAGRLHIVAEVSDVERSDVIWSGRMSGSDRDAEALRERLRFEVASRIASAVLSAESTRATCTLEEPMLDAQGLAMRGAWHFYRASAADNLEARAYLQRARARAPQLGSAHYWLCMTYQQELAHHWSTSPHETLRALTNATQEFRRFHPHSPHLLVALAYSFVYRGDRKAAAACLEEAIERQPRLAAARSLYGQVLAMSSRTAEAKVQLELAKRLNGFDPKLHHVELATAMCHFVDGHYKDMVDCSKASLREHEDVARVYVSLACGLAYLGERKESQRMMQRLQAAGPRLGDSMRLMMASTESEIASRFRHGLGLAGLRIRPS